MVKSYVGAIAAISFLSGCAFPVAMGAGLAASEAFTTATKPNVEVRGTDLYRLADWNNRFDERTSLTLGTRDWRCARGLPGTKICVPKGQDTASNVRTNVIFKCTYGSGGMVGNLVNRDAATMYCRKA